MTELLFFIRRVLDHSRNAPGTPYTRLMNDHIERMHYEDVMELRGDVQTLLLMLDKSAHAKLPRTPLPVPDPRD